MIGRRLLGAAVVALACYAPAPALGQITIPPLPAPSSFAGCGTYLCLTFGVRSDNRFAVLDVLPLPAYAALGAADFYWRTSFRYRSIDLTCVARFGPIALCEDGGPIFLEPRVPSTLYQIGDPQIFATVITPLSSPPGAPPGLFEAYDAAGAVIASERFGIVATPEPATLALTAGGLLVLGGVTRRRRS